MYLWLPDEALNMRRAAPSEALPKVVSVVEHFGFKVMIQPALPD
jgi:hypothetical protein